MGFNLGFKGLMSVNEYLGVLLHTDTWCCELHDTENLVWIALCSLL